MKIVQIRSFFCSVFSCVRGLNTEIYYSVRIKENTDQKKIRIWTLFTQWSLKVVNYFRKKTPACIFGVCLKYASEQCSFNIKTYFKGE